jgi:hypothetical protein
MRTSGITLNEAGTARDVLYICCVPQYRVTHRNGDRPMARNWKLEAVLKKYVDTKYDGSPIWMLYEMERALPTGVVADLSCHTTIRLIEETLLRSMGYDDTIVRDTMQTLYGDGSLTSLTALLENRR